MAVNHDLQKYLKKHKNAKEYEFLFACCRAAFANASVSFPDDVDADIFLTILQRHKLITHLYPLLKECEGIPAGLLQKMQQLLKKNKLHLLKLSGELARLARLFDENRIPWLSIKGPALSVQLYGDVAARQSGDLDILVKEEDLNKAVSLLESIGYHQINNLKLKQRNSYRKHHKDYLFRNDDQSTLIELHWKLSHDWLTPDDITSLLWNNTDKILIAGEQIPIPDKTYHLIYLYEHGIRHTWYRLAWLWDIACAEKARFGGKINHLVFSKEMRYCFITTNNLCRDIFGVESSEQLDNYSKSKIKFLDRLAKKSLLYPEKTKTRKMTFLRLRFMVGIQSGFIRKLKSMKRYLRLV